MGEERIDLERLELASFNWNPWPPTDPAPEIYRIIKEFDRAKILDVAKVAIDTHIQIAEVRLRGLQQIQQILGSITG